MSKEIIFSFIFGYLSVYISNFIVSAFKSITKKKDLDEFSYV